MRFVSWFHITTLPVCVDCIAPNRRIIANDEIRKLWKEAAEAY